MSDRAEPMRTDDTPEWTENRFAAVGNTVNWLEGATFHLLDCADDACEGCIR